MSSALERLLRVPHGTLGGYTNHKCRCGDCRGANRRYMQEFRERVRSEGVSPRIHGNAGYTNHGCRCAVCVEGHRLVSDAWRRTQADRKPAGEVEP